MNNEEETSSWPISEDPSWLQPYCSWCRKEFQTMKEYLHHLRSRLHHFHVRVSNFNRNNLKPLGWEMPKFGDQVRICSGRYRNMMGRVMRTDVMRLTYDIYTFMKSEDNVIKDIPFYSVLKVGDRVTL